MGTTLRACLAALLLAGPFALAHAQAAAPVRLESSICPVDPTAPSAGETSPHGGYITRRTLRADEIAAPIEFEVALRMPNFADLQARVAHGQRISPREMAAKYEPSAADYAHVTAWLTAQGFTITRQQNTHIAVFARGSVRQLQSAMQLTFARVSNGSAEFTSAITAPTVPGVIAPLLVGINGLQPHIQVHKHSILRINSLTGTGAPYTPGQIAQAYNANGLYTSNINGSGQTIAIVIDTFPSTSDLTTFWSNCGINQSLTNFTFLNVNNVSPLPSGTETQEVTLDTEWSSSIAPGAKVRVYASGSLEFTALDACYMQAYDDATANPSPGINQLSMSYGLGEQYEGQSQLQTDDQYFAMLAGAGVGLFASSGDDGATPNSTGTGSNGILEPESPSSDPNVTGVGGTSLTLSSSGSENTEVVWNNSSGATGGGVSQFFNQPSWQTGTGVPSGSMRCVPDVSSAADPDNGAYFYWDGSAGEIGGTSWSSPTWAAFCALINQSRANAGLAPTGQLAPLLYPYIGTSNFRDITSGNNILSKRRGGYTAGVGYDLCSGIGVPDLQALASALSPPTAPNFTDGPPPATTTVNTAYAFTYTASGYPAPSFAVTSGGLPPGLTLNPGGAITGTTTLDGSYTGTVTASNGASPNATQAFIIAVDQAPAFTNAPVTTTLTTGYTANFALTASGYPTPTFAVASGSLPPGLTFSPSGGITGTPTEAGTFTGLITADNGIGTAATQAFSITIDLATDTPTLPPAALAILAAALVLAASRLLPAPQRFT